MDGSLSMKNKVFLVPFPFDDLSATKVRPAVCLTSEIKPYRHLVVAFITSQVSTNPAPTDLAILDSDKDFSATGLKVSSTIRLHRVLTISRAIIRRELGEISMIHRAAIKERLQNLFEI